MGEPAPAQVLISASPVWRGFDPLPVLGSTRDDDDGLFLDPPRPNDEAESLFQANARGAN